MWITFRKDVILLEVKFLDESAILGTNAERLKKILSKYTDSRTAAFMANSFDQSGTLSDGSPSVFAFLELDGYPVIIEAYSFQSSEDPDDPDYELFKSNPETDSFVAVYVIKENKPLRFLETEIFKHGFFPAKAKSLVMKLSKCKNLEQLLNVGLSSGLKKAYEFEKNFPEF